MAKQRYINTKFWSDSFVRDHLNPLDRYLFLYFLCNEKTNIAWIYELPLSIISFETWIEKENLLKMMERLKPKIYYFDGWVYIRNFQKHQKTGSNNIDIGIANSMQLVPDNIIGYIEGIDRVYIEPELLELKLEHEIEYKPKPEIVKKVSSSFLEELNKFIISWNKVESIGDKKWLPAVSKTTDKLKDQWRIARQSYEYEEIKTAARKYCSEIWSRKDDGRWYINHRFTMIEFLKQWNWLEKFLNS